MVKYFAVKCFLPILTCHKTNPIVVTVHCIDYQYKDVKVTYCHTEDDRLCDLSNHIDNIKSSYLFATYNGEILRGEMLFTNFNMWQDNPIVVTVHCIDYQYKGMKVTYCHTEDDRLYELFNHIDSIKSSYLFATYNGEILHSEMLLKDISTCIKISEFYYWYKIKDHYSIQERQNPTMSVAN